MKDDVRAVQVGDDGVVSEEEKKRIADVAKKKTRDELIQQVMNNKAIDDVIAGRFGPMPRFKPSPELRELYEKARDD